jgi:hypothetical protein
MIVNQQCRRQAANTELCFSWKRRIVQKEEEKTLIFSVTLLNIQPMLRKIYQRKGHMGVDAENL